MAEEKVFVNVTKQKGPHLIPMEGKDIHGNHYTVDSYGMMKNGKRFLPIMGEFHFSRWEKEGWREALLKMKAGGVSIVSTYVFWIHHEEDQGVWDFSGCRDVGAFLKLCDEVGLKVWFRIGPFAHGECRNGGFPDWLVAMEKEGVTLRSDDPTYLKYVEIFWKKLYEQVEGSMCKDGGPIIGIQLENEFGHVGGELDPSKGAEHMRTLKKMANEIGFEVPYYTATGWGGAHVIDGEFLPVLGGYVDAPWDRTVNEMPACENFLFIPFHNDGNIGSDAGHKDGEFRFTPELNPYLTAELGAGIQVTGHRRTYPFPEDIEANSLCMLGSGANLLGYYMYHGGINPKGKHSTLEECNGGEWGSDLPRKSYDFATCVKESGEVSKSYGYLKKIHLFLDDFGQELSQMPVYLPDIKPESAEDMHTKRVSVRMNAEDNSSFIFINAHQRKRKMDPVIDLSIEIKNGDADLNISGLYLNSGRCCIIPFGLNTKNGLLLSTNAYLLCKLGDKLVFYTDEEYKDKIYFQWEVHGQKEITDSNDERIILLTRSEADNCFKSGDKLYICKYYDSLILDDDKEDKLITSHLDEEVKVVDPNGKAEIRPITESIISKLSVFDDLNVNFTLNSEEYDQADNSLIYKDYEVYISYGKKTGDLKEAAECDSGELNQMYLDVEYLGDRAEVYRPITSSSVENIETDAGNASLELIDDWFTTGDKWHIALKRFGYPDKLTIRIYDSNNRLPQSHFDHLYYDLPVKDGCEAVSMKLIPEFCL